MGLYGRLVRSECRVSAEPHDGQRPYSCVGFMFINGRRHFSDPEDYTDFINKSWNIEEMRCDLAGCVLPEGMLVRTSNGKLKVVRRRGNKQVLAELK